MAARKTLRAPARRAAKKAPARTSRRAPRRRGGLLALPGRALRWVLRALWALAWRTGVALAVALGAVVATMAAQLPPAEALTDGRAKGSVTMLDADGRPFAWRGDRFAGAVAPDEAPMLRDAIVAVEDRRFYRHLGLSPRGMASAIRINLSEGRGPLSGHGGSTLTQQTAKLLCLGRDYDPAEWASEAAYEADCRRGTLGRKAREALFALALEARYTKDEILTIYMARAYLGASARGAQAAAARYFDKPASALTPPEAALIAGLLVAPSRYAPTRNLDRANARAATVLRLMHEQGYLTQAEFDIARATPARLAATARADTGGYFADWVMASGPDFYMRGTTEDVTVRTTLDPVIQHAAEAAITSTFADSVRAGSKAEAAIVVMSADGAVRAMVGGRDVAAQGAFNRAAQAVRQTGSAFKPFVYAAALDLGHSPLATVVDAPIALPVPGGRPYSPRNYDGTFSGRVTLTEALVRSLNVPAVLVSEAVGREAVRTVAADFGLTSDLALGPALALGASESTLLTMTGAYAGILNGGQSVTPYGLVELRTRADGTVMTQAGGLGERVVSRAAARQLTWMMHRVVEAGTGARARLPDGRPAAGKTGTTQGARDAWFVGFTADYVIGVWMGHDDNAPLAGVTGGGLPAEIWRRAAEAIHAGRPVHALPMDPPAPARAPLPAAPGRAEAPVERALFDVLRDILTGG